MLRSLTAATTRRPRRAVALLLLLLVAGIGVATASGGTYVNDVDVPGIEAQRAQDLIGERFPGQGGDVARVVVWDDDGGGVAAHRPAWTAALAEIGRQPDVSDVAPPRTSPDGRTAVATITYDETAQQLGAGARERLEAATAPLAAGGLHVALAGPVVDAGAEGEMPVGELAGVVAAIVLLLVVLRSLRAVLASLLTAAIGVAGGFALLGLAASGVDIPSIAPTMAAMLGIGAGIDYALLGASRQQEELRAGRSPVQAARRMAATAGHASVTAAFIVLVSISGLVVTGIPFVGKVGVASGVVVLVTALVSVLLLPPLFAAAGTKMLPRGLRRRGRTEAGGTPGPRAAGATPGATAPVSPGWAVRRPRLALLAGVLAAAVLVVPAAALTIGQPDDGNQPAGDTRRQSYDRIAQAFGPGVNGPLVVAIDAGADAPGVARSVRAAVAEAPGVASVDRPVVDDRGETVLLTVTPRTAPQDERTTDLVHELRDVTLPQALEGTGAHALVGGTTARLVDEAGRISDRLPLFALAVVGLSLVLLTLTFRSFKLAALSAMFNLVSIAAAFGVVHLLFQTQAGAGLMGVEVQPVMAYVPLFMVAILFGLSTDYNVFLLSRVREEWQRHGRVAPAVAIAAARTRRTIAAAGAIMIVVFLGFATDPDPTLRMTGVGLASAILIDITLVRMLLVPASLTLLGDRVWRPRTVATHEPMAVAR